MNRREHLTAKSGHPRHNVATSGTRVATPSAREGTSTLHVVTSTLRVATSTLRVATSRPRDVLSRVRVVTFRVRVLTSGTRHGTPAFRDGTSTLRDRTSTRRDGTPTVSPRDIWSSPLYTCVRTSRRQHFPNVLHRCHVSTSGAQHGTYCTRHGTSWGALGTLRTLHPGIFGIARYHTRDNAHISLSVRHIDLDG